jgi:hypothetical protein
VQPAVAGNTVVAAASSSGTKTSLKTGSSAKTRTAMDERLDWLERDLKAKPAPPIQKRERPNFPAIGLGAEQ